MELNSRYLGAIILAPLLIFVFLGGLPLKIFTILISIIGMYEFYNAAKKKDIKVIPFLGYIMLILYYITDNNFEILSYIVILITVIGMIIPIVNLKYSFVDIAVSILGFIYIGILFSFIYLVNIKEYGNYLVWLIFIGSWVCDTLAYYTGRYLGKKKLCPDISPKKTIAGAVGGFLGSIIGSLVFGIIIINNNVNIDLIHFILIGALCGIMGQLGDLVASSIKRHVNLKDYGNLIPGHGGILDRFDSILFNGLVVFYYLTLILNL